MTTAFVATVGGHVSELVELAARIPTEGDQVWITNDNAQTRDLLAGRTVELVPFIGEGDLVGVVRALPRARRLLAAHGVTRVISTGSALALAYLPLAAARGLEAHYIESSTRVSSCSRTGQLLARIPRIRCWSQTKPPLPRFEYLGGVYDRYRSIEATAAIEPARDPARYVVTVGTTDRDFRRLIARLVEILPPEADVLWQTGYSDLDGLDIDGHRLVPEAELQAAMEAADVVISHAGSGSLALALGAGKVPVFVPRRVAYGEQLDDHQVELARWATDRGLAIGVEADEIEPRHLAAAACRHVTTEAVQKLVLR